MIEILDSNDSRILDFTSKRDSILHKNNLFAAESEKVFLQFIANKKIIHKVLATKEFLMKHNLVGDSFFYASREVLEKIAGFKLEFNVIFLSSLPPDTNINSLGNKVIVLNGLSSPENVGSIVRSACAFGITSLVADEKTCSPFLRRCIRVSMGNIFSMKVLHSKNLRDDLLNLKQLGYKIISTANIPKSIDLSQFYFPEKAVIIIGSEGHGIDQDILDSSDHILKINIDPQVAHLNASNAASIFLYKLSNS